MSGGEIEKKTVTIRGLSRPTYERAVRLARELGVTVGELINDALRRYISALETISRGIESHIRRLMETGEVLVISNISSITVSRKDLEYSEKMIVFKDIKELVFTDDITDDIFREKVYKIIRVDTVSIPKTLSAILVASKCELVNRIVPRA